MWQPWRALFGSVLSPIPRRGSEHRGNWERVRECRLELAPHGTHGKGASSGGVQLAWVSHGLGGAGGAAQARAGWRGGQCGAGIGRDVAAMVGAETREGREKR